MAEEHKGTGDVATMGRVVWNNVVQLVTKELGKEGGGGKVFGEIVGGGKGEALDKGLKQVLRYSANARDFTLVLKGARERMVDLRETVAPVLSEEFSGKKLRGFKLARTDNEVIAHQRRRIVGQTRFGTYKAVAGLMDKLPALLDFAGDKAKADGENVNPAIGALASFSNFGAESGMGDMIIDSAISTGAPMLQARVEAKGKERYGQRTAFDMIEDLVEQAASSNGEQIGYVMDEKTGEEIPLADYVLEIFRQHQLDIKGTPINPRFRQMHELKAACEVIADQLDSGNLTPISLIALVGERKVLSKKDLKVTPADELKRDLLNLREIEDTAEVDAEEFIGETAFESKDNFKAMLKDLPEADRAFFASLFPAKVLREAGGLKEAEIDALKERAADDFADTMVEVVTELAEMSPEELQKMGLTEGEASLVQEVAEDLEGLEDLDVGTQEELAGAIRNATGYWQERVTSGRGAGKKHGKSAEKPEESSPDEDGRPLFASKVRSEDRSGAEVER